MSELRADPTAWLLERDNPSVRYLTLRDIVDCADAREAKQARREIMSSGPVPRILDKQEKGGYWGKREDFYIRSKYRGTVWQAIVLAELAADGSDARISHLCDFLFEYAQDRQSGAFAYVGDAKRGGEHEKVLPCLTGNMVWSLIRFGRLRDPRTQRGIQWIARYQRFDDGQGEAPTGWPYAYDKCWGRHTCHMGVVKALKALSEIPELKRT